MSSSFQRSGKSAERYNFSLLSQYFKENGSFGDINLGLTANFDPTGHDLSRSNVFQNSTENLRRNDTVRADLSPEIVKTDGDFRKFGNDERRTSQLTIFYGGQVVVYNDFPVKEADTIMELARKGNSCTNFDNNVVVVPNSDNSVRLPDLNNNVNVKVNVVVPDLNVASTSPPEKYENVERIARRASLRRFFSKKKERAAARAPYQVNQDLGSINKPEETKGVFSNGAGPSTPSTSIVKQEVTSPMVEDGGSSKHLELSL